MYRTCQQFAVFINQAEINAPCVNPNAVELAGLCYAGLKLTEQGFEVPAEMAVKVAWVVFKPMYLTVSQGSVFIPAFNRAPA